MDLEKEFNINANHNVKMFFVKKKKKKHVKNHAWQDFH